MLQQHRKDESAGIVVCCISLPAVRDREDRVLEHSIIVSHATKVIQLQFRQLIQRFLNHARRELDFWTLHTIAWDPRETFHITLRHSLPDHLPREQVSAFAYGVAYRRSVQQFDCLVRDGTWILKWDQRASAVVQQLDRVPIRSRDDRLARTQCIRQRSGNYLRFMPIRSDVDVRGADEFDHFFGTDEAVVEDNL